MLADGAAQAAEIAVLQPGNWDELVPAGKEVDAIYGDYVLRNDQIVAVIAQPLPTRNANMTVRGVGAAIIDLTRRDEPNDQLSAYYPGAGRYPFVSPDRVRTSLYGRAYQLKPGERERGDPVSLEIAADAVEGKPSLTVRYTLTSDAEFLLVETIYSNPGAAPLEAEPADSIRADRTFAFGTDPATSLFWADDEWFRQCYGVVVPGYEIKPTSERATLLQLVKDGSTKFTLQPGESQTIARKIFPASSLLGVRGMASELAGQKVASAEVGVADLTRVQAKVALTKDGRAYAAGWTDVLGKLEFLLPEGTYESEVTSVDGRRAKGKLTSGQEKRHIVKLALPSYVVAFITDANGRPSPAKVSFTGKDGTKDPDWGPDSGEIAVKNVYYTHNGLFKQAIAPGKYDVIVSYGPEHDAVFKSIDVPAGGDAVLKATLKRSVDTSGWISADFHSHSSPSGDNTSSQLGRVLNLLCEHVEFAPCTEHNRIDTYVPHLQHLQVEHLMATCTGMELTGGPLPVNHQNAFPLLMKPRTQDGGAPVTDIDPVIQIERLALWDNQSDKLVQMNHPNLPQILGDRNEDGQPDAGFERMFGFVDVIEVHPPQGVFDPPTKGEDGKLTRNPIFHWLQMLNRGYRISAVINTDSHYNWHESGFYRNFIKSPTDDPAKIDTMEMVHASERGNLVVSTGPFLTVEAVAAALDGKIVRAGPGDDFAPTEGQCSLRIRVQCPNWFDINRVQVFLNGRPEQDLNFTRRTTPNRFRDETVRFDHSIPLELKGDTHVIVATIGEGLTLGPVMGPNYGGKLPPV
ncbi:MAG TPA: CehA/McbA family metallohydrolase, partial [Pirellulaceae bacterium]|nr:CehA/McbA family metallohydrolase [Pirellulaceae bacterium]